MGNATNLKIIKAIQVKIFSDNAGYTSIFVFYKKVDISPDSEISVVGNPTITITDNKAITVSGQQQVFVWFRNKFIITEEMKMQYLFDENRVKKVFNFRAFIKNEPMYIDYFTGNGWVLKKDTLPYTLTLFDLSRVRLIEFG